MKRSIAILALCGLLGLALLSGCGATVDSGTGDGSQNDPVALNIGTPFSGQVGMFPPADSSWYVFTANASTHFIIISTVTPTLWISVYNTSGSQLGSTCFGGGGSSTSCDTSAMGASITASSNYIIEVYNTSTTQTSYTITVN